MKLCAKCKRDIRSDLEVCPFCGFVTVNVRDNNYLPNGTMVYERYKIIKVVDSDENTVTYEAKDESVGGKVNIKEYYPRNITHRSDSNEVLVKDEININRFDAGINEFLSEATKLLNMEGSQRIIDCVSDNGTAYMVLPVYGLTDTFTKQIPDSNIDVVKTSRIELTNMVAHFSHKQKQYNEYDAVSRYIMKPRKSKSSALVTIIVTVLFVMAYYSFVTALSVTVTYMDPQMSQGSREYNLWFNGMRNPLMLSLFSNHPILLFFIGLGEGAIPFIIGFLVLRNHLKKIRKIRSDMDLANKRLASLAYELTNYYKRYKYSSFLMPPEYTNPQFLNWILASIESGKANTPKEAINQLYEQNSQLRSQLQWFANTQSELQSRVGADGAFVFYPYSLMINK